MFEIGIKKIKTYMCIYLRFHIINCLISVIIKDRYIEDKSTD